MTTENNGWSRPPKPGDLVEVGWDHGNEEPFIGVVTEVRKTLFQDLGRKKAFGCVLVDGDPKWLDLYELKLVTESIMR